MLECRFRIVASGQYLINRLRKGQVEEDLGSMQIWRSILGAALVLVTLSAVPLEAQEAPAAVYGELFQQV